MCATVALRNIVGKAQRVFMEGIRPAHRQLDRNVIAGGLEGDGVMHGCPRPVQPFNKGHQPTFIEEF